MVGLLLDEGVWPKRSKLTKPLHPAIDVQKTQEPLEMMSYTTGAQSVKSTQWKNLPEK